MRILLLLLAIFPLPAQALEFHVCIDSQGRRHITNHPEILDRNCRPANNYQFLIFQQQYREMVREQQHWPGEQPAPQPGVKSETKNPGMQHKGISDLFDADKALDNLHEQQQERRKSIPFRTHLQSEGFEHLLDELHR